MYHWANIRQRKIHNEYLQNIKYKPAYHAFFSKTKKEKNTSKPIPASYF